MPFIGGNTRFGGVGMACSRWVLSGLEFPSSTWEQALMASESAAAVPSVGRALTVLEVLAESRNGYTLSDLGRRLGLPKSSLHTMLRTLGERGYVLRNPATHRF